MAPVWLATAALTPPDRVVLEPVYMAQAEQRYQLAPSVLVYKAHQGGLRAYGIPGFTLFSSAYALGQIDAAKLVEAAIKAKWLPDSAAKDTSYLKAVTAQLDAQENVD